MQRADRTTVSGSATLSRRRVLQGAVVALGVTPFWLPRAALAQRAVRPAPGLPTPRYVNTNGIRMGLYEAGDGVPVMFVHGFPELAFSWRNQLRAYPGQHAGLRRRGCGSEPIGPAGRAAADRLHRELLYEHVPDPGPRGSDPRARRPTLAGVVLPAWLVLGCGEHATLSGGFGRANDGLPADD